MKNFVLASIFCVFALFSNSNSAFSAPIGRQNRCAGITPKIRLNFSSSYGKLTYNYEKNTEQLNEMALQNPLHRVLHEKGMFANGLAPFGVAWKIALNSRLKHFKDYACVVPESVDLFFGYRNPVIYISNELEPGTCKYNLVMRHEQQHQQINIEVLNYYLPILKKMFEQQLSVLKAQEIPYNQDDYSRIVQELTKNYSDAITPIVKRFEISLMIEQRRLDNIKNYKYEEKICNDFIAYKMPQPFLRAYHQYRNLLSH